MAARMAIIAMTTSNSIRVNAQRAAEFRLGTRFPVKSRFRLITKLKTEIGVGSMGCDAPVGQRSVVKTNDGWDRRERPVFLRAPCQGIPLPNEPETAHRHGQGGATRHQAPVNPDSIVGAAAGYTAHDPGKR